MFFFFFQLIRENKFYDLKVMQWESMLMKRDKLNETKRLIRP